MANASENDFFEGMSFRQAGLAARHSRYNQVCRGIESSPFILFESMCNLPNLRPTPSLHGEEGRNAHTKSKIKVEGIQ